MEQTSSTPIIDFNAIESQKENVQPLARGRSAHALSNTLTMQHKQRQATLAAQRSEHEQIVTSTENIESDDPLEAWNRYVKWCIDNYPSGQTHESGLVPLLERATRTFKDSEQYTHDSRYLRLWILYARNVECARDVYNFLLANEIGTKLASLYEELAVVLEGQNFFDEADSMYKLGIARRANPIDRLKRRYTEYQQRILQHPTIDSTSSDAVSYPAALKAAMAASGRSVLGHKDMSAAGPTRSNAANVLRGAGASISAIGGTGAPVNNGRKLAVFRQDDDENDRGNLGGASAGGWDDIGTVASRKQENRQADRLGSNFKIGASGGVSQKPGSGLAVFRDSDDEEDDDAPSVAKTPSALNPKDIFSKSQAAPTETDLLRKNPFLHWDANAKLTPDPADLDPMKGKSQAPSVSQKSSNSNGRDHKKSSLGDKVKRPTSSSSSHKASSSRSSAAASSSSSRQERHACPLQLLYPGISSLDDAAKSRGRRSGQPDEMCLDELLAQQRGVPTAAVSNEDPWAYLDDYVGQWLPSHEEEEDEDLPEPEPEPVAELEPEPEVPMESQSEDRYDTAATAPEAPVRAASPVRQPIDSEPTRTLPSRDHFDPDNSADNGLALQIKRMKRKGKPEPTMTMMTKAAMAEVENMFNGDDSSDQDSDDDESSEEEDENDVPVPSVPYNENARMHDENEGVRATPIRPTALGVRTPLGAATPMRTPLQAKSAATPSSRQIYCDDDDDEEKDVDAPLSLRQQEQPAVPMTPAPASRQPAARRTYEPMAEEDEEEEDEYHEDEYGFETNMNNFRPQFQALTPIAEATYEMTRYTNIQTPATIKSWASGGGRRNDDGEDVENGQAQSQADLSSGQAMLDRGLQQGQPERSFSDDQSSSIEDRDRATWGDSGKANFEIPDGLTIVKDKEDTAGITEQFGKSFVIEDRDRALGSVAGGRFTAQVAPPNPCSPVDADILASLLASLPSPIEALPNYVDLSGSSADGKLAELQKRAKSQQRRSMGGEAAEWTIELDGAPFEVRCKLGEGGYAAVFLADDVQSTCPPLQREDRDEDEEDEDEDDEEARRMVAIKAETPPNRWEFYILDELRQRLDASVQASIIKARKFVAYADESFLVLDYGSKGTLLEVVNNASSAGVASMGTSVGGSASAGVDEVLAMFFTIELLRVVEAMHAAGIVHGDLKIDNCLLRLDDAPAGCTWSNVYGTEGWRAKGLTLIDFGRAIDLALYPAGQQFIADWQVDGRDCQEMREARPFTYQTDYHGIASVAFCLLFGRYIETQTVPDPESGRNKYKISATLRRYWQVELWTRLFDTLLNPGQILPITDELRECREEMETWLAANCNKGGKVSFFMSKDMVTLWQNRAVDTDAICLLSILHRT